LKGSLAVVDYRAGNLRSVETAIKYLGVEFAVAERPEELSGAERLIVPGVGEARAAMEELSRSGLGEAITEFWRSGRPLLGICLGAQIVLERSEESDTACLGFIPGEARRFRRQPGLKVPHMGWNRVFRKRTHPVLDGIADGSYFYFVHSYYPELPDEEAVIAECEYGVRFAAVLGLDNLVACQFHPEKSGRLGLALLNSFLGWKP
jgi:glutamine amidotransferase